MKQSWYPVSPYRSGFLLMRVCLTVCLHVCVLGEGRMPLFVTFLINTHDASGSPSFLQPFKVTAPRFAPPFHFFPIHVCCGII